MKILLKKLTKEMCKVLSNRIPSQLERNNVHDEDEQDHCGD